MDVVGLGKPIMDLVMNVDKMPPLDGATHANEMFNQGGGKVATAMVATARLGCKTGMLARVGGGRTGDFVVADFQYNGVDTSRILRGAPGTRSPYCLSLSETESKTRIFIGVGQTVEPLSPQELDFDYIASAKCLHLENGDEASVAAARFAQEKGVTVCIDADGYSPEIEALIPHLDVFIPSAFYFKKRYGGQNWKDVCKDVAALGPHTVIFTFGREGSKGISYGEFFEAPMVEPAPTVDTTGAGDVFHGGYIAGMLQGMKAPEAANYASAVSGIKCTRIGGRTGIPSKAGLAHFFATGKIDEEELDARLVHYRENL